MTIKDPDQPSANAINRWTCLRAAIILASICRAPAVLSMDGDFSESASLGFVLAMLVVGFLTVCFLASMPPFKIPLEDFEPSSWTSNPFSFKQPLHALDFGAVNLLAVGLSALLIGLSRTPANWAGELPLILGIGLWMGVRFCTPKRPLT